MSVVPERGAFIGYEPGGYDDKEKRVVIPFRFNPESLTRSLQVEQGGSGSGTDTGAGAPRAESTAEQGADTSSGTLKETFSVTVRFDLADRHQVLQDLDPALGVAPEIAALESLLHPIPSASADASDGTEPIQQRPRRHTVLFVWGRRRLLPVRIKSMRISESLMNATLDPIRAEVEVSMEVLGETDALDNKAVVDALGFTADKRRELARQFFGATASQGSNVTQL